MNSFELIPTEENLIHTLDKDLLKRNKDLVRFYDLILVQEGASSIAIDGRWGSGKTFFVKQSMLLINAKNPMSDMDDEKKASIVYALPFPKKAEDMPENYDVAVYYDAWENDNGTDPVLSLVYEIIKQLGINYAFDDNSNAFKLAGSVLEALTGRNINGIIENLKSDNPLTKIKEEKDLHENIKNFFTELLVERGNRLVVFIDELDRCKPSYAVQLLERIKHYLYDDRITFVFSVNLGELQHTIKHYYGNTFDACRYLDRFFDMRISLPPADKTAFYREMGLESSYVLEKICRKVIDTYNMELREATRFYRQVKTAAYEPTHESRKFDFSFSDEKGRQLLLMYVVPILITLVTVVFGISCFLLHYGVFVEDLGNVLRIALRLVFYLTGVFWNIMSRLPAPYNNYIGKGNPIAFLITSMRQCVIYGQAPHRKLLLLWFLIGLVLCALGIRKIYKSENSYVKVI